MAEFPFWVIMHRRNGKPTEDVVGFSSSDATSHYLAFPRIDICTVRFISRQIELVLLVADMQQWGVTQIRLDPKSDGDRGEILSLDEFYRRKHFAA